MKYNYSYLSEKLSSARRNLMLPHSRGESESIMHAFHDCEKGFNALDENCLDETSLEWVKRIKEFMDTSGTTDENGVGLWKAKAATLSNNEKLELSSVIDELAHWFALKNHEQY